MHQNETPTNSDTPVDAFEAGHPVQEDGTATSNTVGEPISAPSPEAIAEGLPLLPPGTLPPGAEQILRLISEIEALRRSVEGMANNNAFITAVAKRIVDSEALAPLISRVVVEANHIAQHELQPTFQGLACQLFETVEDETVFNCRVLRHADNHPLNPGGLELYILEHGEWHVHGVAELATTAILDAMEKIDAKRGTPYWCTLHEVWNKPVPGRENIRIADDTASAADEAMVTDQPDTTPAPIEDAAAPAPIE